MLEGSSYLALLLIAMPLKYIYDMPGAVKVIGMLHGILFLIYVFAATWLAIQYKWPRSFLVGAYIASVLPFGPFVFDRKLLSQESGSR